LKTKKAQTSDAFVTTDLQQQREYAEAKGNDILLIAAETFVRSMRDSGYKSTATAIDEFIDNSIQAGAENVSILFTRVNGERLTVDNGAQIAIVDDGHGMDPGMIRLSVVWGGTHRENDRSGFGRYGFGLPSAAVSISEAYSVFSKTPGGMWNAVRIDLKDIANGKFTKDGVVSVPEAVPSALPDWIRAVLPSGDLAHGTIVVLERLDRLTHGFTNVSSFKDKMLAHTGLVYRDVLRNVQMRVVDAGAGSIQSTEVQMIDPLFLRPDGRHYNDNEVVAKALPPLTFTVKLKDGTTGTVRIRYSFMYGPKFTKGSKARLNIRKENNGFIMLRAGRQIDVVSKNPWWVIKNNDKFCGVEIDFDPVLDAEFGVTVNKQQIVLTEAMWDRLEENGVKQAFHQMKLDYEKADIADEAEENAGKSRESEDIAAKTAKFRVRKAIPPPAEKQRENEEMLQKEVARIKRETGRTEEEVKAELEEETFKVWTEDLPGAPFYRMLQVGGQRQLFINIGHRFYTDVYKGPNSSARLRTALELLLIVLGECELDASTEKVKFYKTERNEWSRRLDIMLEELDQREPLEDNREARQVAREEEEHPTATM
jgi:hypothetical protein